MRTRRRFQPMLDSMPSRIAPSAGGGLDSAGGARPPVSDLRCIRLCRAICMPADLRTCQTRVIRHPTVHRRRGIEAASGCSSRARLDSNKARQRPWAGKIISRDD